MTNLYMTTTIMKTLLRWLLADDPNSDAAKAKALMAALLIGIIIACIST